VIFEITASVLAIMAFVKFASYVPEVNLDDVSSLSPSLYIIYVAAALTGIRMVLAFVAICKTRSNIKKEKGSNWEMFWPAFEMIASAASLLMLVSCSLIFSCLMGDDEIVDGEIVEPEVEDLKSDA
jgi:hypothetical protein